MLLRPITLPDELAEGYLGRVMRLNGKSDKKNVYDEAQKWSESDETLPKVTLLSMIAGMRLEQFVCQHTMSPLVRSVAVKLHQYPHGYESAETDGLLRYYVMRTTRPGAYFCPECVQEDLEEHGMSYWHRTLQMPGMLWCPKHQSALRYVDTKQPFLLPPNLQFDNAKSIEKQWVRKFQESPEVQRFIEISVELMKSKVPLYSKAVAGEFKKKALNLKLRNLGGTSKDPLFSDLVVETFDPEWLALTFPEIENRVHGKRFYPLDGLFYKKQAAPPAIAFILAAVVLFDSVGEALDAMQRSGSGVAAMPVNNRSTTFMEEAELRSAYIRTGGDHEAVAGKVQRNKATVSVRLKSLGLPDLNSRGGAVGDFLRAFLVERLTLDRSMSISGIDQKEMERILRIIGTSFVETLVDIDRAAAPKGTINRKANPRVPHEINQESIVL